MRWTAMHSFLSVVAVGMALIAWGAGLASAGDSILVKPDGVEPAVLRTTTGTRVEFLNQTGRAVHVQFSGDAGEHQVVQIPATGPIWVIFHRPGPHPYVIHVYEPKERALPGLVEATEDPQRPSGSPTCSVTVMDVCLES